MSQLLSFSAVSLAVVIGVGVGAAGFPGRAKAQNVPRVADPITHSNLSIYLLRGSSAPGPVPLTLAEALANGSVTVLETGKVNQLEVENTGNADVFIQAGDIVKGGQQDRVLTVSLLLPAKSGRMPIGAFCVEHSRWSARGVEDVKKFASSANAVPSREAKLAMLAPAKAKPEANADNVAAAAPANRVQSSGRAATDTGSRQTEVWATVGRIQKKLSNNLKAAVASGQSASSLQLALENDKLAAAKAEYVKALQAAGEAGSDVVGVAFAINGRVSSAEVYPSNGLFRKMWPKLLDAGVTEAIGEKQEAAAAAPTAAVVDRFLASADDGKAEQDTPIATGLSRRTLDGLTSLAVATVRADHSEIHRTYLAK